MFLEVVKAFLFNVNQFMFLSYVFSVLLLFQIFYPETTDIYDRKNMPRVIYCIHALRWGITVPEGYNCPRGV